MERELEHVMRERRQDAATSAVNHMTLRQGAEGKIDLGELGTVSVSARTVMGEVDIDIRATQSDTAAMLQSTSAFLEAELRKDAVDVRQIEIDSEGKDSREPGGENRQKDTENERGKGAREEAAREFEPDLESSVRFVL